MWNFFYLILLYNIYKSWKKQKQTILKIDGWWGIYIISCIQYCRVVSQCYAWPGGKRYGKVRWKALSYVNKHLPRVSLLSIYSSTYTSIRIKIIIKENKKNIYEKKKNEEVVIITTHFYSYEWKCSSQTVVLRPRYVADVKKDQLNIYNRQM